VNYTFAVVAIIGFFVAGFCGAFILSRDPRSPLHRLFFYAVALIALFDLAQFVALTASSAEFADVCLKVAFTFFVFYAASMFYFIYFFTKKINPPVNSLFYLLLYGPVLIMSCIRWLTDIFFLAAKETHFGYASVYGHYYSWLAICIAMLFLANLYLLVSGRRQAKTERERRQYFWVIGGVLSSIFFGVLFEIVLPLFGFRYVNMLPASTLFFFVFCAVAIVRYGFLGVTPAFLAQSIFDTMSGLLLFVDPTRIVRMINRNFVRSLGYSPEEVIGTRCDKYHSDKETHEEVHLVISEKGEIRGRPASLLKKDGNILPVRCDAAVVKDEFGDEVGSVFIFVDITKEQELLSEQKAAIDELTRAKVRMLSILEDVTQARDEAKKKSEEIVGLYEDLKGVDKMKTDFLSVVSHELRTPITPIKGYASLLLSGNLGDLTDKQKKAVEVMAKESEHLVLLIDEVLDIAQVERGTPLSITKEPVSMPALVKGLLFMLEPQYTAQQISVEMDFPENFPAIHADPAKVHRLLTNLLGNALRFTPKGGTIKIEGLVSVDHIEVQVIDNGEGVAKENLGKLFQKFFQVDSSYTRSAGGMGLGLAISKEIVEAHGGRIWAESEGLGSGTKIVFTLPLKTDPHGSSI
jgi:PAS domain S-box-containing protein